MGDAAGRPTEAQLQVMEGQVRTAMQAGVFGISTALIYPPATFHASSDLVRLAKIPGRCGGIYSSDLIVALTPSRPKLRPRPLCRIARPIKLVVPPLASLRIGQVYPIYLLWHNHHDAEIAPRDPVLDVVDLLP